MTILQIRQAIVANLQILATTGQTDVFTFVTAKAEVSRLKKLLMEISHE